MCLTPSGLVAISNQAYHTPDDAVDNAFIVLIVPATFEEHIYGALAQLTYAENWEPIGSVTPDESANAIMEALFFIDVGYGVILTDTDGAILITECGEFLTIA